MSFRDLKDEIYLVLQVKAGHSFGFATSPLVVTASLAGNVHESYIVEPCPQPKFENEFVWVMDKAKMKNIWAEKVPVRVECFSVNQSRRSRIGYIILNVKDAQIAQDEAKITEKQLRLLGLSREASTLKPELILSFYITDVPIQNSQLVPHFPTSVTDQRLLVTSEPVKVTLGSGRDHFNFTISIINTQNVEELFPSQSETNLSYCYSFLGRELVSDGNNGYGLRVSLVSSLACLKNYLLCHATIPITVQCSSPPVTLGHTTVHLKSLLEGEEGPATRSWVHPRTATCRCVITLAHVNTDAEAWVEFNVTLGLETSTIKKKPSALGLSTVGAGGDADNRHLALPLKPPMTPPLATQSLPSLPIERDSRGGGETYRMQQPFASCKVSLTIISLHLDISLPVKELWFALSNPSGTVSPDQPAVVPQPWRPLQYQLLITQPLATCTPCLMLGGGDLTFASASLVPPHTLADNSTQIQSELRGVGGKRVGRVDVAWSTSQKTVPELTSQSAPTLTDKLQTQSELIGGDVNRVEDQNVVLELTSQSAPILTDTSLSPPTCSQSRSVGVDILSPRSRELKMLSFVEELEDWAEKQRIIIMEGLKEEEAARLATLQAQWEAEVGGQVGEGRQLVEALHNMRSRLKEEEDQLRDNQFKLKVYKEELERVHRNKLQEFKELSRRMQDEFNHKLSIIATDKAKLESEVEQLRKENLEFKQKWRTVEQQNDTDRRTIDSLTHEMTVLKEKLNMEAESKRFFKEHCRKAEQEIHRLNCLRQQEMEARLISDKKSLEHLAFQQIVVEKNDLRQDQRLLNEIRQQLLRTPAVNLDSTVGTLNSDRTTDERHIRRAT